MSHRIYNFQFGPAVRMASVHDTLELSTMAADSLFGAERVELEAPTHFDVEERRVTVEADTEVGRALAALFFGYCRREFGDAAITMSRTGEGKP